MTTFVALVLAWIVLLLLSLAFWKVELKFAAWYTLGLAICVLVAEVVVLLKDML